MVPAAWVVAICIRCSYVCMRSRGRGEREGVWDLAQAPRQRSGVAEINRQAQPASYTLRDWAFHTQEPRQERDRR